LIFSHSQEVDDEKGTVERDQKPLHRPFHWSWNQVDNTSDAIAVPIAENSGR
jgi:hypothetical protein